MEKVGFIGLGRMGRPMASNLCRKGFRLTVNDINPEAVAELELLQAGSAATVAEVAQKSDIIVTMLPNSAVVDDVVSRTDGVIASAKPGSLILDMSTIDPGTTDRLAKAAAAKGIGFVDAPVGRLASHADRGESLFMVGGSVADFERVKPLLEAMGSTIYHCGEVGSGTRDKTGQQFSRGVVLPDECRGARAVAALRARTSNARWTCSTAPPRSTASSRSHGRPRC